MTAEVLSYSRSKGVFGGLELKGTAITADKKDIENVYGSGVNAEKVLRMPEDSAPKEVQPFPETLFSFTPKGAKWHFAAAPLMRRRLYEWNQTGLMVPGRIGTSLGYFVTGSHIAYLIRRCGSDAENLARLNSGYRQLPSLASRHATR